MTRASKIAIGEAVRKARQKQGLTQQDVCNTIKICKPSLIRIEKGRNFPRYDKMIKLIKKLEVRLPRDVA